jgi:hypothetical protein
VQADPVVGGDRRHSPTLRRGLVTR